ncbi:MAG: hypothetical protein KF893_06465 [Caldilineaceae bacterium]|nr:hypothetical protein [Caldilineaceae bacterium]
MYIEDSRHASTVRPCLIWRWFNVILLLFMGMGLSACAGMSTLSTPSRPTRISSNVASPVIEISPASGYAGVSVQVSGQNWPGNTLVLLALEDSLGRSDILAATNATSAGAIETEFRYPTSQRWLTPGEYIILAYTGNGSRQAKTSFTVAASEAIPTILPTATIPLEDEITEDEVIEGEIIDPPITTPTPIPPTVVAFEDWRAEYWDNAYLEGPPALIRSDPAIVFNWGVGSPADVIPADYFSARWRRPIYFSGGVYRFFLEVDDGARLSIDNVTILDEWRDGSPRVVFVDFALNEGIHLVQVEYFELTQRAVIRFWWERS